MEKNYTVEIINSSEEIKGKRAVMVKDTSNAESLQELTRDGDFVFKPVAWVELKIHNERSKNKDYTVFIIIGDDGSMYSTSSVNLFDTLSDIMAEMADIDDEWAIRVFQKASKNRAGQKFLTCAVC